MREGGHNQDDLADSVNRLLGCLSASEGTMTATSSLWDVISVVSSSVYFFFVRVIVLYFFKVCIALFIYFVFMYLCLAYSVSYSDQVLCQFVISFLLC